jgi:Cdc14 phosphatase binding protein N-terminus
LRVQDNDGCDLDPSYALLDVFEERGLARVIISDDGLGPRRLFSPAGNKFAVRHARDISRRQSYDSFTGYVTPSVSSLNTVSPVFHSKIDSHQSHPENRDSQSPLAKLNFDASPEISAINGKESERPSSPQRKRKRVHAMEVPASPMKEFHPGRQQPLSATLPVIPDSQDSKIPETPDNTRKRKASPTIKGQPAKKSKLSKLQSQSNATERPSESDKLSTKQTGPGGKSPVTEMVPESSATLPDEENVSTDPVTKIKEKVKRQMRSKGRKPKKAATPDPPMSSFTSVSESSQQPSEAEDLDTSLTSVSNSSDAEQSSTSESEESDDESDKSGVSSTDSDESDSDEDMVVDSANADGVVAHKSPVVPMSPSISPIKKQNSSKETALKLADPLKSISRASSASSSSSSSSSDSDSSSSNSASASDSDSSSNDESDSASESESGSESDSSKSSKSSESSSGSSAKSRSASPASNVSSTKSSTQQSNSSSSSNLVALSLGGQLSSQKSQSIDLQSFSPHSSTASLSQQSRQSASRYASKLNRWKGLSEMAQKMNVTPVKSVIQQPTQNEPSDESEDESSNESSSDESEKEDTAIPKAKLAGRAPASRKRKSGGLRSMFK